MAEATAGRALACRLLPAELRARREQVVRLLRDRCREQEALPNGYRLRFDLSDGLLAELATLIDLERQCCPFLDFQLTLGPDNGPCWLRLSGPKGTREFLEAELGLGT